MQVVQLANTSRVPVTLSIPADLAPSLSAVVVVGTQSLNRQSGERPVRAARKRVPGTVTLQPKGARGDISAPLPPAVLRAPDVQAALAAWPPRIAARVFESTEAALDSASAADRAHLARQEAIRARRDARRDRAKPAAPAVAAAPIVTEKTKRVAAASDKGV